MGIPVSFLRFAQYKGQRTYLNQIRSGEVETGLDSKPAVAYERHHIRLWMAAGA
jgi:hypothetical protein